MTLFYKSPYCLLPESHLLTKRCLFYLRAIYLDPSIGGISGTSPTRFLIRQFPDPVTGSLLFLRVVALICSNKQVKRLAVSVGDPQLRPFKDQDLLKLLEKPASINLLRGFSPMSPIQDQVRKNVVESSHAIVNALFKEDAQNIREE